MLIVKALAWMWLALIFLALTGLSIWQVTTNIGGLGGFCGLIWLILVIAGTTVLAANAIFSKAGQR